ncbi:zonadhesin-like [Mytilus californianus]|uniref:zonadhesin-like n=1 Tax=Mytilus californianus TaxID=6549 RepID=UPI002247E598|nr:zonadhesin-like [Mytilus californianus]
MTLQDTCNGTAIAIPPALQSSTATTSTTTTTTESPITTEVITTKPTTKLTTTTEQPSTSTTSASTTTKATTTMIRTTPIAPTTKPLTTTKRPITTTHRPTTTTERPTTTTKRPTTTTKRPTTTTKRPTTTTKRPTTTTKRPTITTKRPTTTTKRPTTTTKRPTTTTKRPTTTTKRPTTTTKRPTTTTKRPTTTTERPTTTKRPTTTTKMPITTNRPTTTTERPTKTTKRSKTSTEKPTTITSIPTTQNQAVNLSMAFDSNSFENEEIRTRNYSSIDKTLYETRQNKSHLNISNNRDLSDLTISDKIKIEGKESKNSSIQLNTTNKLIGGSILSSILPMQEKKLTTIYNVKPESGEYIMPTLSYRSISTSFVSNEIAPTVTAGTDSLSDTRTQSEMYHEPVLHSSTPRMSEGQTNGNISTTTASSEIHSMHKSSLAYEINVSPMSFSGVEIITTTPKEHIFRERVSNLHTEPKNKSLEKKENPNSDSNFPTVPIFHIFSRTSESRKIIKSKNLLNILKDTPAMEKTKSLMSGNTKSDIGSEEQKTTPVNRFSVNVATSVHTSEFQPITTQHTTTLFQPITTQKTMPLPPHLFVPRRPIVPIAVTLFDIGRELYSSCTQHSQCPEHAKCRPNACQGYLCLCDEGYIASEDRKFCLRAIRNGERCDPRTDKCLSKFSMCAGVCKCLEFFEHTRDGRCKLPNAGYLGDDCTKRGCQYPSKCVKGKCRCVHPFRKLTAEEFWVSPQSTLQCRMQEYSLDKCNGSYIQVPRDLRPNTTTQPQYTTGRGTITSSYTL